MLHLSATATGGYGKSVIILKQIWIFVATICLSGTADLGSSRCALQRAPTESVKFIVRSIAHDKDSNRKLPDQSGILFITFCLPCRSPRKVALAYFLSSHLAQGQRAWEHLTQVRRLDVGNLPIGCRTLGFDRSPW